MTIPAPWRCPDCHRMNAPHMDHCDCQPQGIITTAPTTGPLPTPNYVPFQQPWPNWPNPYVGDRPGWWLTPTTADAVPTRTITVTTTNSNGQSVTKEVPINSHMRFVGYATNQ